MNEVAKDIEWERWVIDHVPGLLLFARQQSRCEADAQDLVQEAIVESWQRQAAGSPPPLALVFATIRRRGADWARRQDRRTARETAVQAEAPMCWFDSSPEERERNLMLQ